MSSATAYPTSTSRPDGRLLAAAIAGPGLFLAAMVLGLVTGHTSGSSAGSGLELGPMGWLMSIVFIVAGLGIMTFAVVQARVLSPGSRVGGVLLGIAGLGVLLSGVFITDAPGAAETTHGQVHNMLFLVVMLALVVSFPFNGVKLRRNGYRWALAHSIASSVVMPLLVGVFVTIASDPHDPLYKVGALVQFAFIAVGFGWVVVNAARVRRAIRAAA